ncbi:hypothetical protein L3Q82_014777 [Scortum barcoo]|uniref:Uncharacterized protein n=1 Tax=Scortum barcoo TaxID=214431 RepID=A0ACB8VS40_9TELE|nr:hypothetical protein L3Q82_014777 [Scortum barcoo]
MQSRPTRTMLRCQEWRYSSWGPILEPGLGLGLVELSTDHHLVVSWICWQRRKLDRPGRPKRIVRVCWERLAKPSVREVFNSHLRKSFSQITREAESEWTMFSASIVDAAVRSCGCKNESYRTMLALGLLTQLTGIGRPSKPQPGRSWRQKTSGLGGGFGSVRPWRRTIGRPRRDSGKPSGASEGGSSTLPTLFTVQVGSCCPQLGTLSDSGRNTLRISSIPPTCLFKKGDRRVCSNYIWGITLLSLPRKVYTRVLEKRIRPSDSGGTMRFSSYTLLRVLEGLWEFAQPVHMCFVDLEEDIQPCPSWYSVGSAPASMGSGAFAKGCSVSVRPEQELGFALPAARTFSMYWSSLQPSVKRLGMRISTSKSEAMVLDRKRVACPLRVGGEVLPQVEEFKYLGVLFTSEGKMEHEIDRQIGAASAVMQSDVPDRHGEEGAESKGEALDLPVNLPTLPPSPMVGVPGMSHREEALGEGPGHTGDYVSRLAWERLRIPQEELEEVSGVREVWASLLRLLPPRPGPRSSG